jgi:hypothetical protein
MPSPAPALEANSLYQLGQVLSDLSPKLREFYMTRQKQQAELDLAAGQQAALEADGVSSWAEAVSSGVVSPNASPWFQRGFKQRLGRNLALQAQLELMDRYSKSEIRASTDATAIQEFLRENLKEIVGEVDDPLVREGLTPEVDRIVNQMVALHVQNSSTNARAKSVEQLGIAVGLVVDEAVAWQAGLRLPDRQGPRRGGSRHGGRHPRHEDQRGSGPRHLLQDGGAWLGRSCSSGECGSGPPGR